MGKRAIEYAQGSNLTRRGRLSLLSKVAIGLLLSIAVVATVAVSSFVAANQRLEANLRRARDHMPVVRAALVGDPRFSQLRFEDITRGGGSLMIEGVVDADEDLAALRQTVAATNPLVPIEWMVVVRPPSRLTRGLRNGEALSTQPAAP